MKTRESKPSIFVFGSNREGRHGAGAAKAAKKNFGAINGQSEGLQGDSYAIITKELRSDRPPVCLAEVAVGVKKFLAFARENSDREFFLTPIGCGLAGFTVDQIAPMFRDVPKNVTMPQQFVDYLEAKK